jgi:hypothetical protein
VIFLAAAMQAATPQPIRLSLICDGIADHEVAHFGTGLAISGHRAATAIGTSSSTVQSEEQADIEIDGDDSRLRPPRHLFTWLYHPSGWLSIKDVVVTPDAIDGRIQFSWAVHPRIHIDRRVGSVTFDGSTGSYAGRCEVVNPAEHAF